MKTDPTITEVPEDSTEHVEPKQTPKTVERLRRGSGRAVGRSVGPQGNKVPIRAGKGRRERFRAATVLLQGGDEVNIYTNCPKLPQNLRTRLLNRVVVNPYSKEEDLPVKILRTFSYRPGDAPEPYIEAIGMELI